MTDSPTTSHRVLVLGEVRELDSIFESPPFLEQLPVETIEIDELSKYSEAINDPSVDLIVIDAAPHGLEVLDIVNSLSPMRPVLMVADPDQVGIVLEAKNRGLERYIIRLDDATSNIELLRHDICDLIEQMAQPPEMKYPTVGALFRYAQYHNVRQPFFVVDEHRRLLYINLSGRRFIESLHHHLVDIGDTPEKFYLGDSQRSFYTMLDRAFEGEQVEITHTFESLADEKKHRQILYQPVRKLAGKVLAVSIACRNIGAQRRAERRLEKQEETLWRYFERVPVPLAVISDELTIEHHNAAFIELLKFHHADELLNSSLADLAHLDDRHEITAILADLFGGQREYIQAEHRYCTHDGRILWLNLIGYLLNQQKDQSLIVAVDVTRRKEMEKRAEQSMRMESLGELAGGVAHDFNNMLAIVSAMGELLKETLIEKREDQLVDSLIKIEQAIESGRTLTEQLLQFSQDGNGEPQPIDLNEHIQNIGRLLERTLSDKITINFELQTDLAVVELPRGQIDQVIMNLAVNARDAMTDGGTLLIHTDQIHVEKGDTDSPPDLPPGDWVLLQVTDDGTGMPPETRQRIFEPFFTTKKSEQGTGLGLATVYRIVDESGGKIYVDSQPGEGTTFKIYFPASQATNSRDQASHVPTITVTNKAPVNTASILLVEDEDDIREPYRIFLERVGYRVLEASSFEQARAVIEKSDVTIDLLLADVILPDGSGVDVARELQIKNPNLNVIFISGYAPDLLYERAENIDDNWTFLAKPVTRDQLLSAVSTLLQQHGGSPRRPG